MKKLNQVGLLIGILGFLSGYYFYLNPQDMNDNILTIQLLNLSPILQKTDKKIPKFNVSYTYDEIPINELFFAEFIISNTSYNDITENDFINPLQFKTNAEILDIKIENSDNCKFRIEKKEKHKIVFNKTTFKENECIKVKLFFDSYPTIDFSENNIINLNNRDIEVKYNAGSRRPMPKMPIGWYLPEESDGWSRWKFSSWFKKDIITHKQ